MTSSLPDFTNNAFLITLGKLTLSGYVLVLRSNHRYILHHGLHYVRF